MASDQDCNILVFNILQNFSGGRLIPSRGGAKCGQLFPPRRNSAGPNCHDPNLNAAAEGTGLGKGTNGNGQVESWFSACKIGESVASGWQSKLARISRMDWEEIRVRARQEFHKQGDLLLHRMGVRAGALRLKTNRATGQGQFFFLASKGSERAELLRKHLPDEASKIMREADEICGHRFRLLGYQYLVFNLDGAGGGNSVGSDNFKDIDWHLDPVHRKRAPLDPWFKIPFLDFAVVGDHKITWELNRHQHLVTLAKAALLSRDEKYRGN